MKLHAIALILAATSGCAQHLVWHGKTPDRRHDLRVVEHHGQYVVFDGKRGPTFDGIAIAALAFSPNSRRLAYAASRGASWRIVVDGVEGPPFSAVGSVMFSSDSAHVAYAAQRGRKWHVVVDGKLGPAFDELLADSIAFSGDGQHLGYVGHRRDGAHAVLDGSVGRAYPGIGSIAFSADGKHAAYVARRADETAVAVLDDVDSAPFVSVQTLTFAPTGARLAYLAQDNAGWHAVVDGVAGPTWELVRGLAFSRDGAHVAYVARKEQGDTRVVVDGAEGPSYSGIRPASLVFAPGATAPSYIAVKDVRTFVVDPHGEGPAFDDVAPPVFSKDGNHTAYIGTLGAHQVLVVDGAEAERATAFGDVVFDANGKLAFSARRGPDAVVTVAGRSYTFDIVLDGTLVVDAIGQHWGCIAGDRREEKLYVIVDGRRRAAVDDTETIDFATRAYIAGTPLRDGDQLMRGWVAAELANTPDRR